MNIKIGMVLITLVLLQACGGGSSSKSSSSSSIASSVSTSSSASSVSSESSSSESSSSSNLPDWFPTGTAQALPVLNLTTENGAAIVSKDDYINGVISLSAEGQETFEAELEVRGRGNSTWDWDKKPYRLKLKTSAKLLDMPKSKHWVLLANYADKTLMRNDIAFMFSRSIGMEYTTRDRYVELHLNGVYRGVYQLVEHIRVDNDRVNIPELSIDDTAADKISGGYLMEIDFRMHLNFCQSAFNQSIYPYCAGGVNALRNEDYCMDSSYGMNPFCLKNPEDLLLPEWSAQRNYITQYFNDTEAALFGNDFADPVVGYAAYIDVDSAVNYYIINELFKNVDGAVASAFLHKKRDGKLFFGPIWDFDLGLGNAGYDDVDKTYGWHIRKAPWFDRLFQDPAFDAKVKARWQELKAEGKLEQIFQYAEARALWLDQQQEKNFNLWQIFYWQTWYTRVILGSYDAEVAEMIRWQRERMQWMDGQLSIAP